MKIMNSLVSGTYPRSKPLTVLLLATFLSLLFAPFIFQGTVAYNTYTKICIFIVLVASYDMLIGYTRVVSFAHTMFYGIGAYGVAIALKHMGPTWMAIGVGTLGAIITALLVAFLIGLFSLRVKTIFFSMVTLAIASAFAILISKLYMVTGGEDGLIIKTPREIGPAFKLISDKVYGFNLQQFFGNTLSDPTQILQHAQDAVFKLRLNGKIVLYYGIFLVSTLLFMLMLRLMNSPFGRVLQAIRENEFRAEALGYHTMSYRTINVCLSACLAALAGVMMALQLRYVNPDVSLSFTIMVNILLMVVIGGMGTLYGAVVGASLFILAETYLQDLMQLVHNSIEGQSGGIHLVGELLNPDRWLLWLGALFILSVYFIPRGVVGELRQRTKHRGIQRERDATTKLEVSS